MDEALTAVREEFWRQGYAGTSVDRLLEATNLGKGSFYAAFGDKRTLFLRVLHEYATTQVATMRDLHRGSRRAIEALQATLRPALGPRGCFLANCTAELSPQDADVVALARTTWGAFEDIFTETIQRAVAEGDLPRTTRPRALASVLLAAKRGLEFLGRTGLEDAAVDRVTRNFARRLLGNAGRVNRARRDSKNQ
jgi:TetR/AcrR family transcriptional regulator, transcriptional repressor for nem operon